MRTLTLTVLFNIICMVTIGQSELVLRKGAERENIKEGQVLGLTLKGEEFKFKEWKSIYNTKNAIIPYLWEVDRVGIDSIYLGGYNYNVSIKQSKIIRAETDLLKNKNYAIDTIISSATGDSNLDTLVCEVATLNLINEKHKAYNYNDIESFTLAHLNIIDLMNDTNNFHRHYGGSGHLGGGGGTHFSGKGAGIGILVVLTVVATVVITEAIIRDIEAEVHTYNLKEWKVEIK